MTGAGVVADLARLTIDVPDYPRPGVVFKDMTPVLADADAFAAVIEALTAVGRDGDGSVVVDKVAGMEARGFIFAAPVALALGVGFVPIRKPGKLPRATHAISFALEYGQDTLEIHQDAIRPGERVLVIDDVLATGGTAATAVELVRRCGGVPHAVAVLLELTFLPGRSALGDTPLTSLQQV